MGDGLNMGDSQKGNFFDVARYKVEQAKDDLDSAKILLDAEKYKAANNRAYYACFHAVDAVLAMERIALKSIKIPWHTLIRTMSIQKSFQKTSDEK